MCPARNRRELLVALLVENNFLYISGAIVFSMSFVASRHRKFTFINFFVVIVIIGLVSTLLLTSLISARDKARDAKLLAEMSSVSHAASIYYNAHSNYGVSHTSRVVSTTCPTSGESSKATSMFRDSSSGMYRVLQEIMKLPGVTVIACYSTVSTWAVAVNIPSVGTGEYWCVDSAGSSKRVAGTLASDTLTARLCP